MPPTEVLLSFFIASAVFAFVPGPGMLYAAAQTLSLGRRAGWLSAGGFHLAGYGHIAAAAFGLSALLAVSPWLFLGMKVVGGAYLLWMGVTYLLTPTKAAAVQTAPASARKALRDSFIVEALNPKSALFYLAFLPQFADPAAAWPVWAQIVVLGLVVNAMFSLGDAVVIEASHQIASRSARFLDGLRKVGGALLIFLGLKLLLSRPQ